MIYAYLAWHLLVNLHINIVFESTFERESAREVYPSGLAVLENKEKLQENVKNHAKLLKITVWHDF